VQIGTTHEFVFLMRINLVKCVCLVHTYMYILRIMDIDKLVVGCNMD